MKHLFTIVGTSLNRKDNNEMGSGTVEIYETDDGQITVKIKVVEYKNSKAWLAEGQCE